MQARRAGASLCSGTPPDQASQFWDRMAELVDEFDLMPRSGETMYGFAIGIYATDHPTLPTPE
jgi:hypothetical protein